MNIYIPDTLLGDTPLTHCAVSSYWRDTCVPNTLVSPHHPPHSLLPFLAGQYGRKNRTVSAQPLSLLS